MQSYAALLLCIYTPADGHKRTRLPGTHVKKAEKLLLQNEVCMPWQQSMLAGWGYGHLVGQQSRHAKGHDTHLARAQRCSATSSPPSSSSLRAWTSTFLRDALWPVQQQCMSPVNNKISMLHATFQAEICVNTICNSAETICKSAEGQRPGHDIKLVGFQMTME